MEQITKKPFEGTRDTICLFELIPLETVELILSICGYNPNALLVCKEWNAIVMGLVEYKKDKIWNKIETTSVFLTFYDTIDKIIFDATDGGYKFIVVGLPFRFSSREEEPEFEKKIKVKCTMTKITTEMNLVHRKSITYNELGMLLERTETECTGEIYCGTEIQFKNILLFNIMKRSGFFKGEITSLRYTVIKRFVESRHKGVSIEDLTALKLCAERYNSNLTFAFEY